MHIFHPKDFQPNYSVNQGWNPEAIPAIVFFPGGGFRSCGQTAFYRQAVHLATRWHHPAAFETSHAVNGWRREGGARRLKVLRHLPPHAAADGPSRGASFFFL